jgi:rRNA maturation endonuclease Nob1
VIIPKKVKVGNTWYEVKEMPTTSRRGIMGTTDYNTKTIEVATHSNVRNVRYKREDVYDTFWHELTHAILKDMGSNLEADEKFVTAFSERLTQAIISARFK